MQVKNIQILTPLQEGMLFHALKGEDTSAYFEQYAFTVTGEVDEAIFLKSLSILTKRHEPLRTRFVADRSTRPIQLVLEDQQPELSIQNYRHLSASEQTLAVHAFCEADKQRYFKLQAEPLFRSALLYLSGQTQIIISFHHLILDGWSFAIVLKELFTIINALNNKTELQLKEAIPFQRVLNWLQQQPQKAATTFWQKHLAINSDFELTGLPTGFASQKHSARQLSVSTTFDAGLTTLLQQTAANLQVSVNTLAYAIWGILLSRYTQASKVITGITVSGRQVPVDQVTDIVGMCINTIPFAFNVSDDITVAQYIQQVSSAFIESIPYHYCSLADIQQESGVSGSLFDHIVVIEDYPFEEITSAPEFPQLSISSVEVFEETHYPLSVHISVGSTMLWRLAFKPDVYPEAMINQVLDHITSVASQVCKAVLTNGLLGKVTLADKIPSLKLRLIPLPAPCNSKV